MCILCAALGLKHTGFTRIERFAIAVFDILSSGSGCFVRQTQGVGTHIGNQTGQAKFAAQINTFIQFLRYTHGTARHHIEFSGGFLLQCGGGKRRCSRFFLFALLDRRYLKRLTGHIIYYFTGLFLVFQPYFSICFAVIARREHPICRRAQGCLNRPIFFRLKGTDFIFTVYDQASCNRLHAASRQAPLNLAPQKGRQPIAYNTVKDAARLLRINQIQVDITRMRDAVTDGILCDFVEGHALKLPFFQIQQCL